MLNENWTAFSKTTRLKTINKKTSDEQTKKNEMFKTFKSVGLNIFIHRFKGEQ